MKGVMGPLFHLNRHLLNHLIHQLHQDAVQTSREATRFPMEGRSSLDPGMRKPTSHDMSEDTERKRASASA